MVEEYKIGDHVEKISGSKWRGTVVGHYSTALTPNGVCVESDTETGSVQIYPAKALRRTPTPDGTGSGEAEHALSELEGSDFEAIRRHAATLRAALSSTPKRDEEQAGEADNA